MTNCNIGKVNIFGITLGMGSKTPINIVGSYSLFFIMVLILEIILLMNLVLRIHKIPCNQIEYEQLFQAGRAPRPEELEGCWKGQFFGRFGLSPKIITMNFGIKNNQIINNWTLLFLKGGSKTVITENELHLYDFTCFRDEIRYVKNGFLIGRYWIVNSGYSEVNHFTSLGIIHFEKTNDGVIPCLYYILKKVDLTVQ